MNEDGKKDGPMIDIIYAGDIKT